MDLVLVDEHSKIPEYSRVDDGGVDFFARCDVEWWYESSSLTALVPLGVKVEVPKGYVLLIFSRSGHGFNHGISLVNCVGVIDSNYRGEICTKLTTNNCLAMGIKKGERVAQGILFEIPHMTFEVVDKLSESNRGEAGYGSSGA